jgi:hypothetical protein
MLLYAKKSKSLHKVVESIATIAVYSVAPQPRHMKKEIIKMRRIANVVE